MTRDELQKLINQEVKKELKVLVPKLVKPLVQEAVAGALANLLAEGIVKNSSSSTITEHLSNKPKERKTIAIPSDPAVRKRFLADQMGFDQLEKIGNRSSTSYGGGMVGAILAETANGMENIKNTDVVAVDSILDHAGDLDESSMNIIVKDYSQLMDRLVKKPGK